MRDELLAVLKAGRELSEDHDVRLVEAFLDRLDGSLASEGQATDPTRDGGSVHAASASRLVELTSGILSCTVGVTALIYVVNAIIRSNFVDGSTSPSRVFGQGPIDTTTHALMLMVIPLLGVAIGAYLHTLFRARIGVVLLWASAAFAVADSVITTMTLASSLPSILSILMYRQQVNPGSFTTLQVISAVLAVVACGASLARRGGTAHSTLVR